MNLKEWVKRNIEASPILPQDMKENCYKIIDEYKKR